ncbi:MAG TPA: methyltransferase domain-containing protein [candidate division Zixibacteria bacterium]
MDKSVRKEKRSEWQKFFDAHAPVYMDNIFTKNTVKEVDFLLKELRLPKRGSILDMGCGTGRHSIELAKRGYKVTGVDLSSGMLSQAKMQAQKAKVKVEWVQSDATRFKSKRPFDAAICLCEGAFGLLGSADDTWEHDYAILRNINASIKPKAKFILTALNGCAMIRHYAQKDVKSGEFDPLTIVKTHPMEYETPKGKKSVVLKEKGFIATELTILFRLAGFEVLHIWGGTAGNWGKRKLDLDEIEIMFIGRKAN